jgi:DNA-binding NarL/FixJ family response regulator
MNVLLVDDHPLFGFGLVHALQAADASIRASVVASSTEALSRLGEDADIDLVLVDYRLQTDNGLNLLRQIGTQFPWVARVLISGMDTPELLQAARAAGASGFLSKRLAVDELLAALRRVEAGQTVFDAPPSVSTLAVDGTAPDPGTRMTLRQREVLQLIAQGQSNRQIAQTLAISERTVKLHVTALLELFEAGNRTHLLVQAQAAGAVQ